jgi:hypothetical protein
VGDLPADLDPAHFGRVRHPQPEVVREYSRVGTSVGRNVGMGERMEKKAVVMPGTCWSRRAVLGHRSQFRAEEYP